jgi:hypothetical protein
MCRTPQTEDLCGGAAIAMVLRYWGERQVHCDDFAALVDQRLGHSIDILSAEVTRQGWRSFPFSADQAGGDGGSAATWSAGARSWRSSKCARIATTTS